MSFLKEPNYLTIPPQISSEITQYSSSQNRKYQKMTHDHENQLKLTQFKHQLFRMRILVVFMQLLRSQHLLYSFKNVKPISYLQSWELREEVKVATCQLSH